MRWTTIRRSLWAWAALGFVMGAAVFALLPWGWLFVEAPDHGRAGADAPAEVWACPMLCVKLDGPGICPVCGMTLELLEDTGGALELNERERRLVGLETTEVARRPLTRTLRAFGEVDFNQRRVRRITAWVPGRITRLFADTLYTEVREGDHLFELYSPTLYAAQSEYLTAHRIGGRDALSRALLESAHEKLRLYGMTEAQITALKAADQPQHTVVIHAPAGGTIYGLNPREGDWVAEGAPLYTIADDSTLWLMFDAYEQDLPWIAVGQAVDVTFTAWPSRVVPGTVEFIDRAVDPETRTVKVRVVIDNDHGAIKPGMYAEARVEATLGADGRALTPGLEGRYTCYMHPEVRLDEPGACPVCGMPAELHAAAAADDPDQAPGLLAVPRSAVLETGDRQLVHVMTRPPRWEQQGDAWVEVAPAAFEARVVRLGPSADGWMPVFEGLRPGERVVTQGNFLIDSQMELLGQPSLLHPGGGAASDPHADH